MYMYFFIFSFTSGLLLLNNVDDQKFIRLVDRMMNDFEPNRTSSFTEHELVSMKKSLKLNSDQCQCLLNCLNRLLKQVSNQLIKISWKYIVDINLYLGYK